MQNAHRTLGFLAWMAVLAGCASYQNPATGRFESVLIDTSAEAALARLAAAQLQQQLALGPKPPAAYVERVRTLGGRIAAVADRKDVAYRFQVIPDTGVNAFTMFGGDVYVFTGLIEKSTDDELACVLAHEVGHAVARHGVKALQANLGYGILMQAAFQGQPSVATQVIDTAFNLVHNGFSRRDELQADLLAVRYAHRAGYNPEGMITFLQKLQQERGEGPMEAATVYWRTHPLYKDRIALAQAEIARLQGQRAMVRPPLAATGDQTPKEQP
ncbi:MAG: M48 family metalloprotease [Candidatus Omnitrophica bacterium]|nr:M48 family metalloprotease [Candidatus Omnitrophota bacterium]